MCSRIHGNAEPSLAELEGPLGSDMANIEELGVVEEYRSAEGGQEAKCKHKTRSTAIVMMLCLVPILRQAHMPCSKTPSTLHCQVSAKPDEFLGTDLKIFVLVFRLLRVLSAGSTARCCFCARRSI
jgi:hypothetical protein